MFMGGGPTNLDRHCKFPSGMLLALAVSVSVMYFRPTEINPCPLVLLSQKPVRSHFQSGSASFRASMRSNSSPNSLMVVLPRLHSSCSHCRMMLFGIEEV